jgi:hypothetical protein
MDMQTFHHHMLHTTLRTRNPHEATLFYIPVYAVSCATRRVANQTRSTPHEDRCAAFARG